VSHLKVFFLNFNYVRHSAEDPSSDEESTMRLMIM